jgi:hypothetical protein
MIVTEQVQEEAAFIRQKLGGSWSSWGGFPSGARSEGFQDEKAFRYWANSWLITFLSFIHPVPYKRMSNFANQHKIWPINFCFRSSGRNWTDSNTIWEAVQSFRQRHTINPVVSILKALLIMPRQLKVVSWCTYICLMCEYSRRHLKVHFDTPGAPQSESLSQLAYGMTAAKAARLFYQMSGMYCSTLCISEVQ